MGNISLTGRRILITGASRGMGAEVAVACLKAGADIFLTGSDPQSLAETVARAGRVGGRAETLAIDLLDGEAIDAIVRAVRERFGGVDVLLNNAGVGVRMIRADYFQDPIRFWTISDDHYRQFIEINTLAAVRLATRLAPEMIARGWGRIINVTTSLNTMLMGGQAPYGLSKAGLEAITAIMATDLAGTGVTANVITSGGPADTRLAAGMNLAREQLIPADCLAAPVLWLASDEADDVTGRRYLGSLWDRTLPAAQAEKAAGADVAWTGFGHQMKIPTTD